MTGRPAAARLLCGSTCPDSTCRGGPARLGRPAGFAGFGSEIALAGAGDGDFCAEDGGEADGTGGFGEAHDAVEAVVVGEREGFEA
jgi:hypothetical protein